MTFSILIFRLILSYLQTFEMLKLFLSIDKICMARSKSTKCNVRFYIRFKNIFVQYFKLQCLRLKC